MHILYVFCVFVFAVYAPTHSLESGSGLECFFRDSELGLKIKELEYFASPGNRGSNLSTWRITDIKF